MDYPSEYVMFLNLIGIVYIAYGGEQTHAMKGCHIQLASKLRNGKSFIIALIEIWYGRRGISQISGNCQCGDGCRCRRCDRDIADRPRAAIGAFGAGCLRNHVGQ